MDILGNIHFDEENGQLRFRYNWEHWLVPKAVIEKGEAAIQEYATKKVSQHLANGRRAMANRFSKIRTTNYQLTVSHKGHALQGTIVWSEEKKDAFIRLEQPFVQEVAIYYGRSFGSAMAGHRVFDQSGNLTGGMIEYAKQQLVNIWESKMNPVKVIASRLNSSLLP